MPTPPPPKTRSPLKKKPLRQAGASVEEKRQDILDDVMAYLVAGVFAVALSILDWFRYWMKLPYHPWIVTAVAIVTLGIVARKVIPMWAKLRDYREGRDGERVVAERLEELRVHGFDVLHDIVAGNFNLDHVLIGPSGIYVVETKTLHKRGGREEKLEFDGETLRVNGAFLPRDPITQVQANASWLRDFLRESTGRNFPITPLVIFPGWYVASSGPMRDLLVLNDHANGLHAYLVKPATRLSAENMALARTHLRLFIRRPS